MRKFNTFCSALLLIVFHFILPSSAKSQILNNGKLRIGNGSEASVFNTGNLRQPHYFNSSANAWRQLTYSTRTLDHAFGIGGVKTNEWNTNGQIFLNPVLNNQVINSSNYIPTSASTGYGTIISTGTVTINGQLLEVTNTYFLPQNSAYIKATVKLRNVSSSLMENVRMWVGTGDDWVGQTDRPTKTKGNLVNGAFAGLQNQSTRAAAVQITSGSEGVLFYTNSTRGNTGINSCCNFENIVFQNPTASAITATNDGSYGFFVRMNDLPVGASDEFTWYYAAGELADLDDIIGEVAAVSGAMQNITYTTADFRATATVNSTGYWMVVPQNAAAPTAAQIKAGANYSSVVVAQSGSGAMTANVERTFNLTGLTPGTNYDLYFVSQNSSQVFSSIIRVPFATLAYAAPTVSTSALSGITTVGAVSGGTVSADGGREVTARGVVWNTTGTPTTADNSTTDGSGTGAFSSSLTGLQPNTTYYVRAYATNAVATAYGSQLTFTTPPADPTSITPSANPVCQGSPVTLTANGAQGTVHWYTGSCGGTLIGTGNTITVTPAASTTYYARNYNGSFSSGCASVAVTVGPNVPPVPNVSTLPTITEECSASVTAPTATDNCGNTVTGTTTSPMSYSAQGTYTITWTYTDSKGNSSTQTQFVIVKDETPPTIACPSPVEVNTDVNACGAVVNYTLPVASDNCSGSGSGGKNVLLIWDELNTNTTNLKNALTAAGLVVTLSTTSETGYNGTNPSLTGFDAVIHLNGTTYSTGMPLVGQNALVDFVLNKGKTYITDEWSAYEVDAQHTMTAMSDIVVLQRSSGYTQVVTYNVVPTQAGHPILNGISSSFTLPVGGGNVGNARTYSSNQPVVLMTSAHGAAVAVRNFSNGGKAVGFQHAGNYNGSVILSDANVQKLYINAVKYSDGGNISVVQTAGLAPGSLFPVGTTTNTFEATDEAGNKSTCSFDVTVTDAQNPTVITKNITVQLDALGQATITATDVNNGSTDNCSIPVDGYSLNKTAFDCTNVGDNEVTLTVTDANGNSANGTAVVTVKDELAPSLVAQDITIQLDANGVATITPAQVNNGSTDNCSIPANGYSLNKTAFDCTNAGTNIVTLTVTDASGNSASATATVTVQDETPPTVITRNITIQLDASGNASITAAQVNSGSSDACGIAAMSLDKTSFTCAKLGANTVTLTVTDNHGNTATGNATVTVEDKVAPTVATKNITIQLDANGTATIAEDAVNNGSSDACGSLGFDTDVTSFNCSNVGNNTVTLTVRDGSGNIASQTAIVTVEDKIAPVVRTQNITVQLDATGNASITAADINNGSSDACGISTMILDRTSFDCSLVETPVSVLLTVTDVHGNVSTATATVTVKDEVAPTVAPRNITVQLDAQGNATITPEQINNGSSDACGIAAMSLDKTSFTCEQVGANLVTLTVTDVNGNVSTASATVTVEDKTAPVVVTKDITVKLDATGNASITPEQINNGSSDICGIKTLTLSQSAFTCANVGDNTVTFIVEDNHGNTASATAVIKVEDNVKPSVLTRNITVTLVNGIATITAADVNNGSSDACGIAAMTLSKTNFDCFNIGTNAVTLTVVDNNGNIEDATAVVTVVGVIPSPVITVSRTNTTYTGPGNEKTIFLGYGAQSLNLAASDTKTPAATNYNWSPVGFLGTASSAATTYTPDASQTGENTIKVLATNQYGCNATAAVTLTVVDARCGNDLTKVNMCHVAGNDATHVKTICIEGGSVHDHLTKGCKIGSCPETGAVASGVETEVIAHSFALKAAPNPSTAYFNLKVETNNLTDKVILRVMDVKGRLVEMKQNVQPNQTLRIGDNYRPGIYFIEVLQGAERAQTKLIKLNN